MAKGVWKYLHKPRYVDPGERDELDEAGETAAQIAANAGNTDIVELLQGLGFDTDVDFTAGDDGGGNGSNDSGSDSGTEWILIPNVNINYTSNISPLPIFSPAYLSLTSYNRLSVYLFIICSSASFGTMPPRPILEQHSRSASGHEHSPPRNCGRLSMGIVWVSAAR
jgi:hypothetical protein